VWRQAFTRVLTRDLCLPRATVCQEPCRCRRASGVAAERWQGGAAGFPGGRFQPRDEAERAGFAAYALNRRAAEAATLRVLVTAALSQAGQPPLILTGDLNDTIQAATTQLLLGPPGSEIGTKGFNAPDAGDGQRLWNLAPLMPAGKDYSRVNQSRKELIDHILVSAALVKPLDSITVEAIIEQPLPSIGRDPNARRNGPSSDHAPVVATFANA
jgi:endonuclease/exonuclease/phosphatase family metal-dependent hydrolase